VDFETLAPKFSSGLIQLETQKPFASVGVTNWAVTSKPWKVEVINNECAIHNLLLYGAFFFFFGNFWLPCEQRLSLAYCCPSGCQKQRSGEKANCDTQENWRSFFCCIFKDVFNQSGVFE
jgi:hypothetical protein